MTEISRPFYWMRPRFRQPQAGSLWVLAVACLLVAESAPARTGDLILVSCVEQGMKKPPCVLWRCNRETGAFEEMLCIPADGGIRMVKVYPEAGYLAVWRYLDSRSEEDPHGTGQLLVVDAGTAKILTKQEIPYRPVLGGFFCRSAEGVNELVTETIVDRNRVPVLTLPGGESREVPFEAFPWEAILSQGENHWAWCRHTGVMIKIALDSGRFTRILGYRSAPLDFGLGSPILDEYRTLVARWESTADDKAKKALADRFTSALGGGIIVGTKQFMIVTLHLPLVSDRLLIYDKESREWRWFTRPLENAHLQVFGDTLVFQERLSDPRLEGGLWDPSVKRRFVFTDISGKTIAKWTTSANTELLLMEGEKLIFRTNYSIFEATIENEEVVQERLVCEDERFADVHWAFSVAPVAKE